MTDLLFITVYLAAPVVALMMLRLAGEHPLKLSIPTVALWSYLVFSHLGILALHFRLDHRRVNMGVVDPAITLLMLNYSALCLLGLMGGIVFASRCSNFASPSGRAAAPQLSKRSMALVCVCSAVAALAIGLFLQRIGNVPLFTAVTSGASMGKLARSAATNGFDGHYYRYGVFFDTLLPFCSAIALGQALITKRRLFWLLFGALAVASGFASTMLAVKARLVVLMIMWFFTWQQVTGKRITLGPLVVLGSASIAVLITAFYFLMGQKSGGTLAVLGNVMSRAFTGQIAPAYFYLEMFPRFEDFLLGRSFPNPGQIFPWEPYRVSVEVMNFIDPSLAERGIVGSAPTVYWGELYANFGPVVPVLASPVIGFALYVLHALISRIALQPLRYATYAWFMQITMGLAFGGVGNLIVSVHVAAVVLFTLLLIWTDTGGYKNAAITPDSAARTA